MGEDKSEFMLIVTENYFGDINPTFLKGDTLISNNGGKFIYRTRIKKQTYN